MTTSTSVERRRGSARRAPFLTSRKMPASGWLGKALITASFAVCPGLAALHAMPASAQITGPTNLPSVPETQTNIDRNGIDLVSGTPSDLYFESLKIGSDTSSLAATYGATGTLNHQAFLELQRLDVYSGGFIVARVIARGSVHVFNLGTVSRIDHDPTKPEWVFSPNGSSQDTSSTDTFSDYNNDGAFLVCSGSASLMYKGGTCSLYLSSDGTKTDFRMPAGLYSCDLLDRGHYNTSQNVAVAWPTQITLPDGELLTYNYVNYSDLAQCDYNGNYSGPAKWNGVESSLGFRVYTDGKTPTGTDYAGTTLDLHPVTGGNLYAINTAMEYADPFSSQRSFGEHALSSVRVSTNANGSFDRYQSGQKLLSVSLGGSGLVMTRPNGGHFSFPGITQLPPYTTDNGRGMSAPSTPSGAFPALQFSAVRNSTTNYSVAVDGTNYSPERYVVTTSNPDGSTRTIGAQYGLLLWDTDGLGRKTSYAYRDFEGYFNGIPGFSRIAKLSQIVHPDAPSNPVTDGISSNSSAPGTTSFTYSHGALTGIYDYPTDGGSAAVTQLGMATSCTVASYKTCDKPTYKIDPNGGRTDYTYDQTHGGLLKETRPADVNGIRPEKRYSYSQLTPRSLDANGNLVASPPVWRLTRVSECVTATSSDPASCVGTASEHVTSYAYDSPNLFLTAATESLGDGSQSMMTTYGYDYAGNVTSIKKPRGDVDTTQYFTYDNLRRRVFEIEADPDGSDTLPRPAVHHVYDADGNETRTEHGYTSSSTGADFAVSWFDRMTYDPVTGAVIKTERVQP